MSNLLVILVGSLLLFLAYTDQLEVMTGVGLEEYKKRKEGGK